MARCTSSGGSPQYGPNSVGGGTTSSNSMVLFATRATRLATGSACSASSDSSNGTRIRLNISSLLILFLRNTQPYPAKHTTVSSAIIVRRYHIFFSNLPHALTNRSQRMRMNYLTIILPSNLLAEIAPEGERARPSEQEASRQGQPLQ